LSYYLLLSQPLSRRSGNARSPLGWSACSATELARSAAGLARSAARPTLRLSEVRNSGVPQFKIQSTSTQSKLKSSMMVYLPSREQSRNVEATSLPYCLLACRRLRREATWPLPRSFYGFLRASIWVPLFANFRTCSQIHTITPLKRLRRCIPVGSPVI